MNCITDKAHKIWAGKYLYGLWVIEYMPDEKIWLMFPPSDNNVIDFDCTQGATDAAQTLRDAKAMIDNWNN